MPLAYDSSSMFALSVSISAMMSPRLTASPSCLSHLPTVPVSMVSLRRGITTSVATARSLTLAHDGLCSLDHVLQPGQRRRLQGAGIWQRHLHAGDALDRVIQVVEGALLDLG